MTTPQKIEDFGAYFMEFYGFIEQMCTQNTRTPSLQLLLHVICCDCDEKLSLLKMEKAL